MIVNQTAFHQSKIDQKKAIEVDRTAFDYENCIPYSRLKKVLT